MVAFFIRAVSTLHDGARLDVKWLLDGSHACAANRFHLHHILICCAFHVYRSDNACQAASRTEVCVSTNGEMNA